MGEVLGDLAEYGYDAEWANIPAVAVGAPHLRYRVFLVAYTKYAGLEGSTWREALEEWRPSFFTSSVPALRTWGIWQPEPDVGRVAHGVPARVDRLRALGNAVVPQVAEWVGRRILEARG
jgi:DNA (cytosine-5)-methyltransferase 1